MTSQTGGQLGRVRFYRSAECLCIHEQWNPDRMSRKDRQDVAAALESIAALMRSDTFMVGNEPVVFEACYETFDCNAGDHADCCPAAHYGEVRR